MFAWTSHGTELKRFFRHRLTRAAIAVMLLIPLLYGAMYVWAFWDPTSRMGDLPVALVNEDRPATVTDQKIDAGTEIVDKLTHTESVDWHVVDAAQAQRGVEKGDYYFAVTIPEDFSSSLASLGGDHPHPATIDVTYDDANSFLASTLGHNAMLQIRQIVSDEAGATAIDQVLIGLSDVRDGLGKASDGAISLQTGIGAAGDGAAQLSDGARRLDDGASQIQDGAAQLRAGTSTAAGQVPALADGVAQLSTGAQQLRAGIQALDQRMPALASGTGMLADGAHQSAVGADQLAASQRQYVAGITKAQQGVAQLDAGIDALTQLQQGLSAAADPNQGAPALAAGAEQLATQMDALAAGARQLADGSQAFAAGATDFAAGAQHFVDSSAAPIAKLDAASGQVATGAQALPGAIDASHANVVKARELIAAGQPDQADALLAGTADALAGTSSAAASVSAGATQVHDGLAALDAAAGQLSAGAQQLTASAKALSAGATQLDAGATQLAAAGPKVDQLAAGARTLADGITTMSEKASAGIPQVVGGVHALNGALSNPDPTKGLVSGASAISAGADRLAAGTNQLDNGAAQVNAGVGQLVTGVQALDAGAQRLDGGMGALDAKIPALVDGVRALDAGAGALAEGAQSLHDGTATLASKTPALVDGLDQLQAGSQTLAKSLAEGRDQIPSDSTSLRTDRAGAMVSPVRLSSENLHAAASWGEGFAPFFIALGLWVGALVSWLLLRPLATRALMTSVNGFRMAWGALNPALLVAAGQVFVMLTVMHFAVGLDPAHVAATIAFTYLTAAAFFALQQFFQVWLGPAVGKVVIIALLMVQLASAGGTYPVETEPEFFQAVSPWMPITYVVQGLRSSITGAIDARFWTASAVLGAIFVVSLALTSVASARKRVWTMSRLHPVLEI